MQLVVLQNSIVFTQISHYDKEHLSTVCPVILAASSNIITSKMKSKKMRWMWQR
jgi:hypothetical protein